MKKDQAVIFDMDGVIVDSEPRHEKAFLEVVAEIGYGETHGLRFADYIGQSDNILWKDFVARHRPEESLDELIGRKRRRVIEILQREEPLFRGLPELIEQLKPHYQLAVASGSERTVVEAVLGLRNLKLAFSATVTSSEVRHGKPAPDIFLRTAELLGVTPEKCWVIEDSKPGVKAGLAAGMKVIAITNSHSAKELREATQVVRTYEQIAELLLPGKKAAKKTAPRRKKSGA